MSRVFCSNASNIEYRSRAGWAQLSFLDKRGNTHQFFAPLLRGSIFACCVLFSAMDIVPMLDRGQVVSNRARSGVNKSRWPVRADRASDLPRNIEWKGAWARLEDAPYGTDSDI